MASEQQVGKLVLRNNTLILLVPAALSKALRKTINNPGIMAPPGFKEGGVIIMTPAEVRRIGAENIKERGHEYFYTLGKLKTSSGRFHNNQYSKIWWVPVLSPSLKNLRKAYGLPASPLSSIAFKLIVGVQKVGIFEENNLDKLSTDLTFKFKNLDTLDLSSFKGFHKFAENIQLAQLQQPEGIIPETLFNLVLSTVKPFLVSWAARHGYTPISAEAARNAYNSWLSRQASAGFAQTERQQFLATLLGLFSFLGYPPTEQLLTQVNELLDNNVVSTALYALRSFAPDIWDQLLGGPGSIRELSSAVAYAGDATGIDPEKVQDITSKIMQHFWAGNDPKRHRYFSARQLGQIYNALGIDPNNVPIEQQISLMENAVGIAAAVRDEASRHGFPIQPVTEYLNIGRELLSKLPLHSDKSVESLVREYFNTQRLSQIPLNAQLRPGLPTPEQLQQLNAQLLENAKNSEWAHNLAALRFAVENNFVSETSPAAAIYRATLQSGVAPNLPTHAVTKILAMSGFPGGETAAGYFVGQRQGLKNWITPDIAWAVRASQGRFGEERADKYLSASIPKYFNPQQRSALRELMRNQFFEQQFGYPAGTFDVLHPKNPFAQESNLGEALAPIRRYAQLRSQEQMANPSLPPGDILRRVVTGLRENAAGPADFADIIASALGYKRQTPVPYLKLREFKPIIERPPINKTLSQQTFAIKPS